MTILPYYKEYTQMETYLDVSPQFMISLIVGIALSFANTTAIDLSDAKDETEMKNGNSDSLHSTL